MIYLLAIAFVINLILFVMQIRRCKTKGQEIKDNKLITTLFMTMILIVVNFFIVLFN
ncbi:MAG: hypothetical protein ACOWWH_05340 [Eubacteriaceae bacterium]